MSSYSFLKSRAANAAARCEHGASLSGRAGTSRPPIGAPSTVQVRHRRISAIVAPIGTKIKMVLNWEDGRTEDEERPLLREGMVPKTGLEPARVAPHAP